MYITFSVNFEFRSRKKNCIYHVPQEVVFQQKWIPPLRRDNDKKKTKMDRRRLQNTFYVSCRKKRGFIYKISTTITSEKKKTV